MILYIGEGYPSLCRNLHHTSKLSALSMYSSVCADVGRQGRDSHSSQPFHCYAEARTLSDSVLQSVDLSRPLFYKDLSFVSFRAGAAVLRWQKCIWWHGNALLGRRIHLSGCIFTFLSVMGYIRWSNSVTVILVIAMQWTHYRWYIYSESICKVHLTRRDAPSQRNAIQTNSGITVWISVSNDPGAIYKASYDKLVSVLFYFSEVFLRDLSWCNE